MSEQISKKIRQQVASRADFRCEYCRIKEEDSFLNFQIDHIVSKKHGGGDEVGNLAYACPHCNQNKGADLTTFIGSYDNIIPLFHPRKDSWFSHFKAVEGTIEALTETGEATIKLLRLNDPERVIIRKILHEVGAFP